MRANFLSAFTFLAMASLMVSGRTLQQQVTSADLTNAIREINRVAKVPDTSKAVALTPGYKFAVARLQGPATEIVQAAGTLTAPAPSFDRPSEYYDYLQALKAYGYQSGKEALAPAGQALYDAYDAITNALHFSQT